MFFSSKFRMFFCAIKHSVGQQLHYIDVIMGAMASQIICLTIFCSTVYTGADQREHQSAVSLAFVRRIHRWPVNSLYEWPVTRKMFPFEDVIMIMWWWYIITLTVLWITPVAGLWRHGTETERLTHHWLCVRWINRWIPRTVKEPVIWDAMALIWRH